MSKESISWTYMLEVNSCMLIKNLCFLRFIYAEHQLCILTYWRKILENGGKIVQKKNLESWKIARVTITDMYMYRRAG